MIDRTDRVIAALGHRISVQGDMHTQEQAA